MNKLHIDADMLIFKASAATQHVTNWADEGQPAMISMSVNLNEAIKVLEDSIYSISKACLSTDMVMHITSCSNFRKFLNPDYKGNRKGILKPIALPALQDYMRTNYNCLTVPDLEADDTLSIAGWEDPDAIIVSGDKDMQTIPCRHYNHLKPDLGITSVSKEVARTFYHLQVLMGDATDGFPGLAGCGKVGALKMLTDVSQSDMEAVVIDAFRNHKKIQYSNKDIKIAFQMPYLLQPQDFRNGTIYPMVPRPLQTNKEMLHG